MLKAIKKFLGIKEKTVWIHDRYKLAEVLVGAAIIDNGGITEGWPCVEWTKNSNATWGNGATIVSSDYFTMPFMVVREASDLVKK